MKKTTNKFWFSVEGETEKWYLEWLEREINNDPNATCKVSFKCEAKISPIKYVKKVSFTGKTTIYHIFDYECNDELHQKRFKGVMDDMKKAEGIGKSVTYKCGYTNFTFDLWIILHKINYNSSCTHRKQYIKGINRAFNRTFQDMTEFKEEKNFKKCLESMSIASVRDAIDRAKKIEQMNQNNGYKLQDYRGYKYYNENPSLSIWEAIEEVLVSVGL